MRILVTGLGRMGTTALTDRIARTFPELAQIEDPKREPSSLRTAIIKANVLYAERFWHTYKNFDKKVMIVRDPRDWCVSALLYRAHATWHHQEDLVRTFVRHLQEKEAETKSHSVTSLYRDLKFSYSSDGAPDYLKETLDKQLVFAEAHQDVHLVWFDQLVSGELGHLELYLGRLLDTRTEVHKHHSNVVRKKEVGDWKNWFLPEDVDVFRPRFENYMATFRFGHDWELPETQIIKPQHGSAYALKLINDVRMANGLPAILVR